MLAYTRDPTFMFGQIGSEEPIVFLIFQNFQFKWNFETHSKQVMNTYYDTSCKLFLFYLKFICSDFWFLIWWLSPRLHATSMEFENIWNIKVLNSSVLLITKGKIKPLSFSHWIIFIGVQSFLWYSLINTNPDVYLNFLKLRNN